MGGRLGWQQPEWHPGLLLVCPPGPELHQNSEAGREAGRPATGALLVPVPCVQQNATCHHVRSQHSKGLRDTVAGSARERGRDSCQCERCPRPCQQCGAGLPANTHTPRCMATTAASMVTPSTPPAKACEYHGAGVQESEDGNATSARAESSSEWQEPGGPFVAPSHPTEVAGGEAVSTQPCRPPSTGHSCGAVAGPAGHPRLSACGQQGGDPRSPGAPVGGSTACTARFAP